jgi:hypothetical protein
MMLNVVETKSVGATLASYLVNLAEVTKNYAVRCSERKDRTFILFRRKSIEM